jgi:L-lactate dehydrogenase complex protein LldF
VYRKIGGHSFPWIYSGPIGAIITPQFLGIQHTPALPFASSLCGACAEVCPVKIDIPKVLLDLRAGVKEGPGKAKSDWLERLGFHAFAWLMCHPKAYALMGRFSRLAPLLNIGPLRAWRSQRDLPAMPAKSFRQLWKERG